MLSGWSGEKLPPATAFGSATEIVPDITAEGSQSTGGAAQSAEGKIALQGPQTLGKRLREAVAATQLESKIEERGVFVHLGAMLTKRIIPPVWARQCGECEFVTCLGNGNPATERVARERGARYAIAVVHDDYFIRVGIEADDRIELGSQVVGAIARTDDDRNSREWRIERARGLSYRSLALQKLGR